MYVNLIRVCQCMSVYVDVCMHAASICALCRHVYIYIYIYVCVTIHILYIYIYMCVCAA